MISALNEISTCRSEPTQGTMDKCNQVLDYASTHPNATIHYHARDIILITDTDAAYIVLPEDRSRIAGYYYFTNCMLNYSKGTPTPNVHILTECKTLKTVASSSAESETGGTFENAQDVIPLRHIPETVYLHQQPTKVSPIITDNITSQVILTHFIKTRRSKTWYVRYHWLEDRIIQKHIQLIWKRGMHNFADDFTKHHPPAYYKLMIPKYLVHCLTHSPFPYR